MQQIAWQVLFKDLQLLLSGCSTWLDTLKGIYPCIEVLQLCGYPKPITIKFISPLPHSFSLFSFIYLYYNQVFWNFTWVKIFTKPGWRVHWRQTFSKHFFWYSIWSGHRWALLGVVSDNFEIVAFWKEPFLGSAFTGAAPLGLCASLATSSSAPPLALSKESSGQKLQTSSNCSDMKSASTESCC